MGCNHSKGKDQTDVLVPRPAQKRKSDGPLTAKEIEKRIDASSETKLLKFEEFSMRYAYVCQRGYYPDGKEMKVYSLFLKQ